MKKLIVILTIICFVQFLNIALAADGDPVIEGKDITGSLNLTSGNVIGDLTLGNGNLVPATSGKGVDFSAITGGYVVAISITNGGTGYAAGTLSATGGGGTGFAGTYTVSGGVINTVTITNMGTGYTSIPTLVTSDAGNADAVLAARITVKSSGTLSWYEEGAYYTDLICATSGTITLSSSILSYTRIGRLVTITGEITVGSVNSPVGDLRMILPYPVIDLGGNSERFAGSVNYGGLNAITTPGALTVEGIGGGYAASIVEQSATGKLYDVAAHMKGGSILTFGFTYLTDFTE